MKGLGAAVWIAMFGCSAPAGRLAVLDAAPPGPSCGNCIVDPPAPLEGFPETCDDGPLNGTPQSLCTKQCKAVKDKTYHPAAPIDVGSTIGEVVPINFMAVERAFAVTNFDDTGVHVINFETGVAVPTITLEVASAPVALGSMIINAGGDRVPFWVEGPTAGDPALHLYYAVLTDDGGSTIREIPYPFPDGTRPSIVNSPDLLTLVLLDQSRDAPHDLLVAVINPWPTTVKAATRRVPAPGLVRGVVSQTTAYDPSFSRETQQLVQFFDDTGTFVALEARAPSGSLEATEIVETARGRWPFHIVAAGSWLGGIGCAADGESNSPTFEYAHPWPIMVLTDAGELYPWHFSRGLADGELPPPPFARVPAGTRSILTPADSYFPTVYALEPSGAAIVLHQSDCNDLGAPALQPQVFPFGPTWTTSVTTQYSAASFTFASDSTLWVPQIGHDSNGDGDGDGDDDDISNACTPAARRR